MKKFHTKQRGPSLIIEISRILIHKEKNSRKTQN
jgi:hypothetical protein